MPRKKNSTTEPDIHSQQEDQESISAIQRFFKDQRLSKITALVFLFFGIITAVAFVSYFCTWKEDQDEVFQFSWGLLLQSKAVIDNKMGRLGAILSHQCINQGFGIGAFIIPYLLFAAGFSFLLSKGRKKLVYNIAVGIPFMFLVSTAMATIIPWHEFSFGGALGAVISQWMLAFVGNLGTYLMLGFSLLIGLVLLYNINLLGFWQWFKPKTQQHNVLVSPMAKSTMQEDESEQHLDPYTHRDALNEVKNEEEEEEMFIVQKDNTSDTKLNKIDEKENDDEDFLVLTQPKRNNVLLDLDSNKSLEVNDYLSQKNSIEDDSEPIILDIEPIKENQNMANEPTTAHTEADEEFFPYDPTLDLSSYQYPHTDLLIDYKNQKPPLDTNELQRYSDQIIQTLNNYNIEIQKIKATVGPTVTLYEIVPAAGVRISKIKNLEDDIALSLAALGIRIIAPIPGKGTIGIEVPNVHKEMVSMRSVVTSPPFVNSTAELPLALGKTISNEIYVTDLAKMPHLLMAGATGQGKSVGLNAILASLLYKKHPSQLKFVLIDPKKVELSIYRTIEKHFLAKLPGETDAIITDTKKVINTVNSLCIEMDDRYDLLKQAGVRNIAEYNKKFTERKLNPNKGHKFMPYIVLVIDEFADLIMTAGKEVEMPIARLAQLARAIGIHLIIATQRPSVNIITGTIKANFPARIAFKVSSKVDSRTILDAGGADQLIGKGDMLISNGGDLIRVQCAYLDLPEVDNITQFISEQRGYPDAYLLPEYNDDSSDSPNYIDPADRDPLFVDAARIIVATQQGSTSNIQRKLKLGYNRAGRIMDQMESAHIVGAADGSKPREVLVKTMEELEQFLNAMV